MNILDPRFKYVPSHSTDIRETFRKYGFKPTPREQQERLRDALNERTMPDLRLVPQELRQAA